MLARIPFLVQLYVVVSALMFAWNLLLTGRIAQLRRVPRRFALVTTLAGFLLAPAAIVAFAASSAMYGRALQPVAWVWPFTTLLFVIQAIYATSRGLVRPLFGVPIVLYDLVIAAVAIAKYITLHGGTPPNTVLALAAAQANALGIVFGSAALWTNYVQVPILAPALPAHWRITALGRVGLATIAMIVTGLVIVEIPDGVAAIRSYARYADEPLQERSEGDFRIGVKILPTLTGLASQHAVVNDTAVVRRLQTDAIAVVIRPEGVRNAVLDSLSRTLDNLRTDGSVVVVMLGYPRGARAALRRDREAFLAARVQEVDRITRWLRPTIFVPAIEPYDEGMRHLGLQPPAFWQEYLRRTAAAIREVRPATRVAYAASSYGVRDSVLYHWAAGPDSPIDILGFSLWPGFDGALTLDTRMRIAQRWMRRPVERPKNHWVLATGGFPGVHGEINQAHAIWGVTTWATAQSQIKGVIVFEAGDYDAIRGLKAPDRRFRPAFTAVQRAKVALRERAE